MSDRRRKHDAKRQRAIVTKRLDGMHRPGRAGRKRTGRLPRNYFREGVLYAAMFVLCICLVFTVPSGWFKYDDRFTRDDRFWNKSRVAEYKFLPALLRPSEEPARK